MILHQPGLFELGARTKVLAIYPLIPWTGVLLLGYVLGPIMLLERVRRQKWLCLCGGLGIAVFVTLRLLKSYGDPAAWVPQEKLGASVLSFVNCEKYPPSLLFLAMTLGPALLALAFLDRATGTVARFFTIFGRVPFFYYLAHIYLIHVVAVLIALLQSRDVRWLFHGLPPMNQPAGWGLGLPSVYLLWLAIVLVLYAPCRWFASVKQARKSWWLSYL